MLSGPGWDGPSQVIIGHNGLAWGRGLHSVTADMQPLKREGDGRSPAGMFKLGTIFGFAPPEEVTGLKMPYAHITEVLECIDDTASMYYNKLVRRDKVIGIDWRSSEKMMRYDPWYRWGVFVLQNSEIVEKDGGSCIFLHNTTGPGDRTSGCTAIDPALMTSIVFWLDVEKQPVFVLLHAPSYRELRAGWKLPALP